MYLECVSGLGKVDNRICMVLEWTQGRIQEIEKGGSGVMRARCARKFLHLIRPLLVDHTHLIADKCW